MLVVTATDVWHWTVLGVVGFFGLATVLALLGVVVLAIYEVVSAIVRLVGWFRHRRLPAWANWDEHADWLVDHGYRPPAVILPRAAAIADPPPRPRAPSPDAHA